MEYATHTREEAEGNERVPSGYEFATLQAKLSELDFVFLNRFIQVGLHPQHSSMVEAASHRIHCSEDAHTSGCKPGQHAPGPPICTTVKLGRPSGKFGDSARTPRALVLTLGSWMNAMALRTHVILSARNLTAACLL